MKLVKIEDTSSFAKARLAKERKRKRMEEKQRKEALESKVLSLESDVSEIKELLTKVLEKL